MNVKRKDGEKFCCFISPHLLYGVNENFKEYCSHIVDEKRDDKTN